MPRLNEKTKDHPIWLIHGAAGTGKTRVAGTASKHYVERAVAARTSTIALDDVLFVQFDRGGVQSLQSLGLDPAFIDLSNQPMEAPLWVSAVSKQIEALPKLIAERGYEYLVIDTVTTAASYLDGYFLGTTANAQLGYGRSQAVFQRMMSMFIAVQCKQIWLAHSRSAYIDEKAENADAKASQAKATRPGSYAVDIGLTRGNGDWLRPKTSVAFAIEVQPDLSRRLVTGEGQDYYVKNRFADLLAAREPANIRSLMAKIEKLESTMANE